MAAQLGYWSIQIPDILDKSLFKAKLCHVQRIPVSVRNHIIHIRKFISNKSISIVLVHGLGMSGDYYIPFAEKLARHYDVYVVDLPGYGRTPKPNKPLTIIELSDVLHEYVRVWDLKNVVLIGQSMGCQIVAHTLRSAPKLFLSGILLAPTVNKHERSLVKQGYRLLQDFFFESIKANGIVIHNYLRMGPIRYFITTKYMVNDHIEQTLQYMTVPLLLVSGSNDRIAPTAWVKELSATPLNGSFREMNSAPHLMQYQKPIELVAIVRQYLGML